MITDKLKELEALKEKAAALEAAVEEERRSELASLPAEYGFDNVEDFLDAVLAAGGGRRRNRPGRPRGNAQPAGEKKERRARATITEETRAQVKQMVDAGKTGSEIAQAVGISLPSVQNIKKALGLVRARK